MITLNDAKPQCSRLELRSMGYTLEYQERTCGPVNAIYLDWDQGIFWGESSNHGEDYGIGW